jgi:hypothetical protein
MLDTNKALGAYTSFSQTQSSCDGAVSEYQSVSYSQPYLQLTEIVHVYVVMVTICSLLGAWSLLRIFLFYLADQEISCAFVKQRKYLSANTSPSFIST